MKSLRDANVGENLKVAKIKGDGPTKRRIMDMGLSLIHISEPTRRTERSRMPSSA